jgi:inner membrane protein
MDNISHAVVSLVSGELLHRSLPEESSQENQSRRRKLLLITTVAAGNFPDLDLVLSGLLKEPLGYLLHHRGHSHTIVGALFEALLLFAIVYGAWPAARLLLRESASARRGFSLAMAIGFALHLSMDWLNSYGVHPFYPVNSSWFYGDLVFIIEPVFWVAFGVSAAFLTTRHWLRFATLALVCGFPTFALVKGYLPFVSYLALVGIALAMAKLQSREAVKGRRALLTAWAIGLTFVIGQAFASSSARAKVRETLQKRDSLAVLLDDALTAYPSNPLCWSFTTIEKKTAAYRLRSGAVSIFPSLFSPESCAKTFGAPKQARALGKNLFLMHEDSASLANLQKRYESDCHFRAWARFARMPFVTETEASDLRFIRDGSYTNFTTMKFDDFKDETCPAWVPGWTPPREDLLTSQK